MKNKYSLAYPRRPLFLSLAIAGAIAAGSIALSGVPAPASVLSALESRAVDAGECDPVAESFYCADGTDNNCDGDVDCDDLTCAYSATCGCPWWDLACAVIFG